MCPHVHLCRIWHLAWHRGWWRRDNQTKLKSIPNKTNHGLSETRETCWCNKMAKWSRNSHNASLRSFFQISWLRRGFLWFALVSEEAGSRRNNLVLGYLSHCFKLHGSGQEPTTSFQSAQAKQQKQCNQDRGYLKGSRNTKPKINDP